MCELFTVLLPCGLECKFSRVIEDRVTLLIFYYLTCTTMHFLAAFISKLLVESHVFLLFIVKISFCQTEPSFL